MKVIARALVAIGVTGMGAAFVASAASAHVSPDRSEVAAGSYTAVTLTVPHGCEGSPTREVAVQIPASINDVTPGVVPGWDIEVVTEVLDEPIEGSHGEQLTERESEVVFTAQPGNELPDGFRQSFTLGFRAPDTPGEHLFFKTVQTCLEGEAAWIEEFTGEGDEPDSPAPVVLVTEATGDGHGGGTSGDTGDDVDDAGADAPPVSGEDAASNGGDGGSSNGLAIAGIVLGALGLGAGGTALARTRG